MLKNHDPAVHKYKYHVESSATKNGLIESLEFIVGPATAGGVIDRFLTVYYNESQLQDGCKWVYEICIIKRNPLNYMWYAYQFCMI